jgi:hypothetical protein
MAPSKLGFRSFWGGWGKMGQKNDPEIFRIIALTVWEIFKFNFLFFIFCRELKKKIHFSVFL